MHKVWGESDDAGSDDSGSPPSVLNTDGLFDNPGGNVSRVMMSLYFSMHIMLYLHRFCSIMLEDVPRCRDTSQFRKFCL